MSPLSTLSPRRAAVVGVVGARGGAGASTVAAALAVVGVARGLGAVLVDGQHTGAGVEVLLGAEEEPGLRWADLEEARGDVDATRLLGLLPQWAGVRVLSADRRRTLRTPDDVEPDVLRALRSVSGLVVLDLPPGRVARHAGSCDAVVVVARGDTLSVAGALAVRAELAWAAGPAGPTGEGATAGAVPVGAVPVGEVPVGLVCRGDAHGRTTAHGIAAATGIELWGELLSDRSLAAAVESGAGPTVRLSRAAPRSSGARPGSARRGRTDRPGGVVPAGPRGRRATRTSLGGVAAVVLDHVLDHLHGRRTTTAQAGR